MAKVDGNIIIEDYLTIISIIDKYDKCRQYKNIALMRLSMSTIRRSRDIKYRSTILLYLRLAAFISPVQLINPVYYFYLIVGAVFGHWGLGSIKIVSKNISSSVRRLC